jgi:hypothetical protein
VLAYHFRQVIRLQIRSELELHHFPCIIVILRGFDSTALSLPVMRGAYFRSIGGRLLLSRCINRGVMSGGDTEAAVLGLLFVHLLFEAFLMVCSNLFQVEVVLLDGLRHTHFRLGHLYGGLLHVLGLLFRFRGLF